jgi:hypothetical protein
MRRGIRAVRLTVQALQLTLLLGSLGSLLLLGSLSLLLSGLLLRRKPLLRSAQPLIGARLRGRSPLTSDCPLFQYLPSLRHWIIDPDGKENLREGRNRATIGSFRLVRGSPGVGIVGTWCVT